MTAPAEIFELRGLADTLLIGPRAAFGRGARLALGSEDAVRLRLLRALADGGGFDRLRHFWARWGLAGDRFFDASDRVLADRVAAALRNGRLAAYVIPNSPLTYVLNPDLDRAEREVAALKPELAKARPTMAARNVRPPPTLPGAGGGRRATFGTAIDQPIVPGGRAEGGEPTAASALRIDALSLEQRLSEVLDRTRPRLPPALRAGYARAMSPLAFTTTVAVLAAWGARPLVTTPHIMDGVRLGLAPQPSGLDLAETTEEIRELLAIVREATVEAELDRAAALLARAIARMGVLAFIRAMQHAAERIASHWRAGTGKFDKVGEKPKPVQRTVERPAEPVAPLRVEKITPTRKKGEAGFDEAKMYEKFEKSKTAKALEDEVLKKGYKYAGDVSDPKSSAYTDVAKKEIRINKNKSEEEAALAYAYELQNAKNGDKYNKIFEDAQNGKIKNKKEFADKIMQHEVEALETEAIIAMEMGIKDPKNKDVIDIVKATKDPAERSKKIREWADNKGQIKGMSPTKYYEKMYEDNYGKKP